MFRRPLFSIFFPIYRFCHPVLPSFKQYTCSAAPFFNLFSDIQVLPFWAKFSLVWFSLGFDMGLVQNHKRWLTLIQRILFRSSSQVNVETVQIPLINVDGPEQRPVEHPVLYTGSVLYTELPPCFIISDMVYIFLSFSILVLPLCLGVRYLGLNSVLLFLVTVPLQVFIQNPYPKVFFRPSKSHNQHQTRLK